MASRPGWAMISSKPSTMLFFETGLCRSVFLSQPPPRTSLFLEYIQHSSLSNTTLQPTSQIYFVGMSEECSKRRTMWDSIISCGSHRMSKLHVWVDQMRLQSGKLIAIGYTAILMLTASEPFMRKCKEAPSWRVHMLQGGRGASYH
jgi:hypothetical protein